MRELEEGGRVSITYKLREGDVISPGGVTAEDWEVIETKEAEDGVFEPNHRVVLRTESGEETEAEGELPAWEVVELA